MQLTLEQLIQLRALCSHVQMNESIKALAFVKDGLSHSAYIAARNAAHAANLWDAVYSHSLTVKG